MEVTHREQQAVRGALLVVHGEPRGSVPPFKTLLEPRVDLAVAAEGYFQFAHFGLRAHYFFEYRGERRASRAARIFFVGLNEGCLSLGQAAHVSTGELVSVVHAGLVGDADLRLLEEEFDARLGLGRRVG